MPTLDDYARAGMAAIEDKRIDDAIENFRKALELDPDRPDLNNALGTAYMHRGEVGSAIEPFERAVELAEPYTHPEHEKLKLQFHLALAAAYQMADRMGDASRALERIIARWPSEVTPRLQLGQLLLQAGRVDDGVAVYRGLLELDGVDAAAREALGAVIGAVEAYQDTDHQANVFLRAHAESYKGYFDEVAAERTAEGWYAEAARMARGADGEPTPVLPEGARPYAMQRVDLVNPANGEVAGVYSEQEPMIVALNGLEPLAQMPTLLPWDGHDFPVMVSSQSPWHWLPITVAFEEPAGDLVDTLDAVMGPWYLDGFNGDFGDKDAGRFHYITDPDPVGDRAVSYVVDLGRARYEAIESLLRRLAVLHEKRPIRKVILGNGYLAD